jgi:hypothetical protein
MFYNLSKFGIIMLIMKKRTVRATAREFASIPNDKHKLPFG